MLANQESRHGIFVRLKLLDIKVQTGPVVEPLIDAIVSLRIDHIQVFNLYLLPALPGD